MRIIKAGLAELPAVTPLFNDYRKFYGQESNLDSARQFLHDRILLNESIVFVAIENRTGKAMGFVQIYPSFSSVQLKRVWILNDLFVHPDFRKRGVASALIERIGQAGKESGIISVMLETMKANTDARRLYDKTGFKEDLEHAYYTLKL